MKRTIILYIYITNIFIIHVYGSNYDIFLDECNQIESIGYSQNKSISKAIKIAKIDAQRGLTEEFIGVIVNSSSLHKITSTTNNNKENIIEIFKSQIKTNASGYIKPIYKKYKNNKIYLYDSETKMVEVTAKIKCDRSLYKYLKKHI